MNPRLSTFIGGGTGIWRVTEIRPITGAALAHPPHLDIVPGDAQIPGTGVLWALHGATSNARYTTAEEKAKLTAIQAPLGRAEALCAVLIPIRKNEQWWTLPQDERRRIFEEQSRHNGIGLQYLPAVARRLYHCRDLSTAEPFDFLTWFEFAKSETAAFERLLAELRATPEWKFVDRELEIRCQR